MTELRYGLKLSKPDSRDFAYVQERTAIRASVDLRMWASPIEDQSKLGSCVANAIANAYELEVKRLYPEYFVELSKLFIYYNTRLFDNTVKEDAGAYIRDGLKAVKLYGVCTEQVWPYELDKFDDQPTLDCYGEALSRTITEYRKLITLRDMLETLSADKPVVVGMVIYESFDLVDKQNPVIPLPTPGDRYLGGHAVTVEGYDLDKKQFLIKNSYGTEWGDGGYGYLPFEYLRTEGFEKWRFEINDQAPRLTLTPLTENPVVETEEPVIEPIVIDEPVIESVVEEPIVIKEPIIEEPIIEEPIVIEEPIIEEPIVIEEPVVVGEPIVEEPVVALKKPTNMYGPIINQFRVLTGPKGIGLKRLS